MLQPPLRIEKLRILFDKALAAKGATGFHGKIKSAERYMETKIQLEENWGGGLSEKDAVSNSDVRIFKEAEKEFG